MKTLVFCYLPVILNAIKELEKEKIITLVNVMCEQECLHPKNISRLDFLSFQYSNETLNLIKKYTEGIDYNEDIYNKLYKNMYRYMCNIGRHNKDFQETSDTDYIHSFNLIYHFLYGYLTKENIELVIFDHTPHVGYDDVLYDLCQEFGIKTIILQSCVSPLTNIPFLQYAFKKEDAITFQKMSKTYRQTDENLIENFNYKHCYMKGIQPYTLNIEQPQFKRHHFFTALLKSGFSKKKFNKILQNYLKRTIKTNMSEQRKIPLYLQYDENRKKYTQTPNYNEKFVYFPLHLQPELTTSVNGGIYCDQVLAIERLSKIIPDNWFIYVKENPKQNEYMRGNLFFKRLHLIKNIKYIDVTVPSSELLQNCQFCATINGTASFESICGGKPTLIFGQVWWDFLPGIFKYKNNFNIEDLLNYKIDKTKLKKLYNEYLSKTIIGTLYNPKDYTQYSPKFNEQLNTTNCTLLLKDLISQLYKNQIN